MIVVIFLNQISLKEKSSLFFQTRFLLIHIIKPLIVPKTKYRIATQFHKRKRKKIITEIIKKHYKAFNL